jgi:hypothetical protein
MDWARRRGPQQNLFAIADALGTQDTQPEPRDEEDGDSEKAS